ncbi:hypothetical protein ACSNOH_25350 [Streptomyces sp. URMC 127]|uniref:hypothetical protein n=1 Tax=Streptomyces sp. URMC 127 TaxID=3423402 RepID=UPI003F198DE0
MRTRTRQALGAAVSALVLAGTLGAGVARAGDLDPPPPAQPPPTEVSAAQCLSADGTIDVTVGDDFAPVLVCRGGTYDGRPVG